jgi:flagellar protein FlaG
MIIHLSQIMPTNLPQTHDTASAASPSADAFTGLEKAPTAPTGGAASDQSLNDAVDKLNSKAQNLNRNLEFSIDQDSGEVLVKVVDAKTHEVIRQIPSDEALAMARNIDKYLEDHHLGLVQAKA